MYQEMSNNKEKTMKKQHSVCKQKITKENEYDFAYILDSPTRRKAGYGKANLQTPDLVLHSAVPCHQVNRHMLPLLLLYLNSHQSGIFWQYTFLH